MFAAKLLKKMKNNKRLIVVVGPTAIGKTALGIRLAQYFQTEIISADSRQFFKEMSIGTAVPNPEELAAAKHHFIQHISIKKPYSIGDFEKEAIANLEVLFQEKDTVIMVGGSGMYVDAVCNGIDKFPEVPLEIKQKVQTLFETEGLVALAAILKEKDPTHYANIALQNPQRVMRAVEVCLSSGKPYSSFLNKHHTKRPFEIIKIGIQADREIIYDRINCRVDIMVKNGLLDEAKSLLPRKHLNALNTVGYKELFQYFDGNWELEFAISEIKKNTRRFAKRQLTWYRKDSAINWVNYNNSYPEAISILNKNTE